MTVSTLNIRMTGDATAVAHMADQVSRHMQRIQRDYARTARELESVAKYAMLRVTAPIVALGGLSIRTASNIEEQMSRFRVVFRQHAGDVEQWAQVQAEAMNRSEYDLMQYAATYQDTFVPLGFARAEAAELSKILTTLAVDLASFANMAEPEVVNNLTSAIVGNHRAVRSFGVVITEAALGEELLKMGIQGGTKAASEQQKVVARMRIILNSTRDAQGDAIRTAQSFANQQRAAGAQTREAAKAIGDILMPAAARVLGIYTGLVKAFNALSEAQKRWLIIAAGSLAAIPVLLFAIAMYLRVASYAAGFFAPLTAWAGQALFAFAALRGGAASLSEALAHVGLTAARLKLLAFAGLVAAAIWLVLNWDRASHALRVIWHGVSAAVLYGASLIVRGVGFVVSALAWVVPALRPAAQAVTGYADGLKQAAATAAGLARSTAQARSTQAAADAANAAADAQGNLAGATEDAADAAQRNLQSFDEVHTIQEDMAGGATVPGMDFAGIGYPMPELPDPAAMTSVFDRIGEIVGTLAARWGDFVSFAGAQWERLRAWASETFPWLDRLIQTFADAAQWVRDNWATVAPVLETLAGILALVGLGWLIATSPIAAFIALAGAVALAAAWVIANWERIGPWFESLWNGIKAVALPIWESIRAALADIWNGIVQTAVVLWGWLQAWWAQWGDTIMAIARGVWRQIGIIIETAINLVKNIIGLVLAVIRGDWSAAWEYVKGIGETIWRFLVRTWENIKQMAAEVWESIKRKLSEAWDAMKQRVIEIWTSITAWLRDRWHSIRDTVSDVFGALRDRLGDIWDRIVGTVRSAVDRIMGPINDVIYTVRRALDWLAKLTGGAPAVPTVPTAPIAPTSRLPGGSIPAFQHGGVLLGHRPTLALLHPPEAVIPLRGGGGAGGGGVETIADAVARAVYAALRDAFQVERARGGSSGDRELVLQIDGQRIARVLVPAIRREEQRTGIRTLRPQEV